jgi:hypothetical protein
VYPRAGLGVLEKRIHLSLSGIEAMYLSLQSVSVYRLFSSVLSYGTTNKMIGKPGSKSDYNAQLFARHIENAEKKTLSCLMLLSCCALRDVK